MSLKQNQEPNNKNLILEKFQAGEISIKKAFKLLTDKGNSKELIHNKFEDRKKTNNKSNKRSVKTNSIQALKELDQLVGLEKVKSLIQEYIAFLKVQKLRKKYGLKNKDVVMHMIFKGNPGTGKTTVARIIGKIFNEIGYLENGKMLEAERADLVGEYIGHTAKKTKEMVEKAMGGVLFIDEAYALARGGKRDFGKESIDTLVKAMEDNRDDLIIILAGYRNEMEYFLQQNPGLRSRFSIHLDFPDYSIEQLIKIAELMYHEREYILTANSKHYLDNVLTKIRNNEGSNKGNARTVRNVVERSIRHQAQRIMNQDSISVNKLKKIKVKDLARGRP